MTPACKYIPTAAQNLCFYAKNTTVAPRAVHDRAFPPPIVLGSTAGYPYVTCITVGSGRDRQITVGKGEGHDTKI